MDIKQHLFLAKILTDILENKFRVGKFRFGFDPIIGVIPGIGDTITFGMSFYLVWIGVKMKMPQSKIFEMLGNVFMDFIIGLIPVLGDLADVALKANSRNLKILEKFDQKIVEAEIV